VKGCVKVRINFDSTLKSVNFVFKKQNPKLINYNQTKHSDYLNNAIFPAYNINFTGVKKDNNEMYLDFDNINTKHNINAKYRKTISRAYEALGKNNVALICHGVSFPSLNSENTGYGSANTNGAENFMKFSNGLFNAIQLGPQGLTKMSLASPYSGTSFSQNILTVDLKSLTGNKWHHLLSEHTFKNIVKNNPSKYTSKASYKYAFRAYNNAFDEIYHNFKHLNNKELKQEFENYKEENKFWLEADSLYEALTVEHGNDNWIYWGGKNAKIDKRLFDGSLDEATVSKRINEIKDKYEDEIERYKLIQFIASKQAHETKEIAAKNGIKMIADRQVGFSDRDVWAHKSAFLDGWFMGCPADYFSKDGQAWGFNVLNPDLMFDSDGNLDEAGQLMYNMFYKIFKENSGGVRIDHIIGLIDPWWYREGSKPSEVVEGNAARLYSTPMHKELGKYSYVSEDDLNPNLLYNQSGEASPKNSASEIWVSKINDKQIDMYAKIINDIVLKAAHDAGLENDSIIAEDLGTLTYPVQRVISKLNLRGIRVLQFVNPDKEDNIYRGKNIQKDTWVAPGTHDNPSIWLYSKNLGIEGRKKHAKNLVEDLYSEYKNKDEIYDKLVNDYRFFAMSKLTEAFACPAKNVQISFMDMFGYLDVYNVPGTTDDEKNWCLGLRENFKQRYLKSLENSEALNLPFVLSCAIRARGEEFAMANKEVLKELDSLAYC